jgi:hypothetical protein
MKDTIFATCPQKAANFKEATAGQFSTIFAQKSDAVTSKALEGIHCALLRLHQFLLTILINRPLCCEGSGDIHPSIRVW